MTKIALSGRGWTCGAALAVLALAGCGGANDIEVVQATYGASCRASAGNATSDVADTCNGEETCRYTVDVRELGDPLSGCEKNFVVEYRCGADEPTKTIELPAEAGLGSVATLTCP
jgi:hypothetical protein